jgi:hypothetical protein
MEENIYRIKCFEALERDIAKRKKIKEEKRKEANFRLLEMVKNSRNSK